MKNENEKKGLFERLLGGKKTKKSSCCCNIELEEIPDATPNNKDAQDSSKPQPKNNSCCK